MRRLALAVPVALALANAAAAQTSSGAAAATDTSRTARPALVSRGQAELFAAALGATFALAPLDRGIRRSFQGDESQQSRVMRGAAATFSFLGGPGPFLVGGGLATVGCALGQRPVATLGLHVTEGVLLAAGFDGLLKGLTGRALPRPSAGDPDEFSFGRGFHHGNGPYVSFPSGHTAAAFAAAAVLTGESAFWRPGLDRMVAPIAYGGAGLVALSRLYEDQHWASDLPLGAAIGIWSGTTVVVRAHLVHTNRIERWLLAVSVVPNAHGGVVLTWESPTALGAD